MPPLPFTYHPSPHALSGLGEEGLTEGGFHVHIYLSFHIAPQTFCTFLQGTGRNPGLIPGNMESAGDRATEEGTWVPRLERRAKASCLADSPGSSPLVPVTSVCHHPQKAQPLSFRLHLLVAQSPTPFPSAPRTPGPCPPEPCSPEPCPRLGGVGREGHHVPHTKEGGRPGGGPHRQLLQRPLGGSPSLPKAAGAPRLGPNLEGRGQFNKNITLTFFPGGTYSVT